MTPIRGTELLQMRMIEPPFPMSVGSVSLNVVVSTAVLNNGTGGIASSLIPETSCGRGLVMGHMVDVYG